MYLVGGIATPLKNMSSSNGIIVPNWMETKNMFETTKQYEYNRRFQADLFVSSRLHLMNPEDFFCPISSDKLDQDS